MRFLVTYFLLVLVSFSTIAKSASALNYVVPNAVTQSSISDSKSQFSMLLTVADYDLFSEIEEECDERKKLQKYPTCNFFTNSDSNLLQVAIIPGGNYRFSHFILLYPKLFLRFGVFLI